MNRTRPVWITLLLVWSLLPMLWQLVSSFTSSDALVSGSVPFDQRWTLAHYRDLFSTDPPFWRYLLNSAVVGTATTLLTLLLGVPASYAIARMTERSKRRIRLLVSAAALFPYVLLFLALLELARRFHLGNNLLAVAIPYTGLALPLALLLLISAFEGLPRELDDAARLEGLVLHQRLRWILLPLIAPATASTGSWCSCSPGMNIQSPSPGSAGIHCSPCPSPWPALPEHRSTRFPTGHTPLQRFWARFRCWGWFLCFNGRLWLVSPMEL